MDPTISVSKVSGFGFQTGHRCLTTYFCCLQGCFVYKNGATRAGKKAASKRKRPAAESSSLLGKEVVQQPFYEEYRKAWNQINDHIADLQHRSYARTLEQLVDFVVGQAERDTPDEVLPTAALLTGINQPDHLSQFTALTQRLHAQRAAMVCVLQSRDCATLKAAVETLVFGLVEDNAEVEQMEDEDEDEDGAERDRKRLRRSQCTMKQLKSWYTNNFDSEIFMCQLLWIEIEHEDISTLSIVFASLCAFALDFLIQCSISPDCERNGPDTGIQSELPDPDIVAKGA